MLAEVIIYSHFRKKSSELAFIWGKMRAVFRT